MLPYLLLTVSIVFSNPSTAVGEHQDGYNAKLNNLIDEITTNIGLCGKEIGLEPLKIPDIYQEKQKDGISQGFNLTQGELFNITSIQRFGDAEASYRLGLLNVKAGIQFTELEGNFNFVVKSWGLSPSGHLKARIPHLVVTLEASIDAINLNGTLDKVLIPFVGDMQISVETSKPIYGLIMDALIDTLTVFFQDELVYILGKVIRMKANEILVALPI